MKVTRLKLEGLLLVELVVHGDQRGFFTERYHRERFREAGLPTDFSQDNHSRSAPGVLRGLHYQTDPTQGKLVGATRGRIWVLLHSEPFATRSEAMSREWHLKRDRAFRKTLRPT